jgi:mandelate racemase
VDRGADRYDNFDGFARLSAELKTPIQIGENFYGSRDLYRGLQVKACDLVMRDFMRSAGSLGSSGRRRPPERRPEGRL